MSNNQITSNTITKPKLEDLDKQKAPKSKRRLHHFILCPFSRKVRLLLHEKKIDFSLIQQNYWDLSYDFIVLNPAKQVPVLVEENGAVIPDSMVITEYLEEVYPSRPLIDSENPYIRCETRRLERFVDDCFWQNSTKPILEEKALKKWIKPPDTSSSPLSERLRKANKYLKEYLNYFTWLLERRRWLAGKELSIADFSLAAHISVLDYLNSMNWKDRTELRQWYVRMKSRSSFKYILEDNVPGNPPPKHYADLNF